MSHTAVDCGYLEIADMYGWRILVHCDQENFQKYADPWHWKHNLGEGTYMYIVGLSW